MRLEEAEMRVNLFPQRDVEIVRGEGAHVYDASGRAYLDCGVSYGACNLGHGHPAIVRAIEAQVKNLQYIGSTVRNDTRRAFMEALRRIAPPPLERIFLCNSGTEAVEAALKFARAATRRSGFVAAKRAFHGRTMGALSVTWKPEFREAFEPLLGAVDFVPFNDEEALKAVVNSTTAAVILEPVQGEGGVYVAKPEFLRAARDVCDDHGALLVLDEVQTGLGRTGRLLACEWSNVKPDALCLAKSLAGGFPMGATLISEDVHRRLRGSHNSTFGGNPLACAAGLAALEVLMKERLWEQADRLGGMFLDDLRSIDTPEIREVRGIGFMTAVELRGKAAGPLRRMQDRGVLAIPGGRNIVRFLPPLVIRQDDLGRAARVFKEVIVHG